MKVYVRWPGASLLFAIGTLLAFSSTLIVFFFGVAVGLPLLGLAGLFLFVGRRPGTLFQWDRFFPADPFAHKNGIAYRDLTGVIVVPGRVVFVPKVGNQTSIPISAGTATILNHLVRVGVRVEHKLSDVEWHRAQKAMILWDWLDKSAVFRTHAWIIFVLGVPALGVYLTMLSARGNAISSTAWMENALFIGIITTVLSAVAWGIIVYLFGTSHGRPGESLQQIEKGVRGTDIWSGVVTAACMAAAIGWFYFQESTAARRGFEQPSVIAEAFGRTAPDRAPASRR